MDSGDIIRMAREARLAEPYHPMNPWSASQEALERFAALVAAREREDIIAMLSRTEFTSLDHMPSEAALIIRLRGGP